MGMQQSLLGSIDDDQLKALLYGEITSPEQEALLQRLAAEAGVEVDLLRPATGDIDTDRPSPANPHATYDPADAIYTAADGGLVTDAVETRPASAEAP